MRHNDFSVRIPKHNEAAGGYVEIEHGTKYTLSLRNFRSVRCDARVEIDGKHVGTWRIEKYGRVELERPVHDAGCFTAYIAGTADGDMAGLDVNDPNLGLIRITFMPEKVVYEPPKRVVISDTTPRDLTGAVPSASIGPPASASFAMPSASFAMPKGESVGTGLSGKSGQQFYETQPLSYDHTQTTVIHLRLVSPSDSPRPLTSPSTPVPPPVR